MEIKVMEKMIAYFGNDVKRINHALKVYSFAYLIAENELQDFSQKEVVHFSGLLHDIGIKEAERKYHSNAGKYQEREGPKIAKKILKELFIAEKTIDRVCYIIGHHHTYEKIDGLDFQILVEADFLVNIFEDCLPKESIFNIKDKIFKTECSIKLLEKMYL
ncbi:HD domain-containing protein [Thermospira aquatica]|uniref:HD domain-containing protein n=1 Tax=Thermospira aquatica TaxID=2828656 RepID=A0AAX3BAI6_9SPIR|nr:HD domain-containing protein [Thermospira aquatica]URA09229.1 HD domain-containing protein [Thermospira aquatica]